MAELKISFIEGNSYRIEGAIEELLTNKRAKMMLRSQLVKSSSMAPSIR